MPIGFTLGTMWPKSLYQDIKWSWRLKIAIIKKSFIPQCDSSISFFIKSLSNKLVIIFRHWLQKSFIVNEIKVVTFSNLNPFVPLFFVKKFLQPTFQNNSVKFSETPRETGFLDPLFVKIILSKMSDANKCPICLVQLGGGERAGEWQSTSDNWKDSYLFKFESKNYQTLWLFSNSIWRQFDNWLAKWLEFSKVKGFWKAVFLPELFSLIWQIVRFTCYTVESDFFFSLFW